METFFSHLGIIPRNISLYDEALTHPSANKKVNYERLEYLGDAVIELISTQYIFSNYPEYLEGKMTKLRALVVSRPSLAMFAESIQLGDYIKFSTGELKNGGRTKKTNLSNAFEALVAAIYLDLGYDEAQKLFLKCAQPLLDKGYTEKTGIDNPKGKLQEILQDIVSEAPVYEVLSETGPDHNKQFKVRVSWQNKHLAEGVGGSKKAAERVSALLALESRLWESQV